MGVTIAVYILVAILLLYIIIFKVLGLRIINSDEVGVIEKWWSIRGSLKNSIIALNGEAGYSPDLLRGGMHFRTAFMYKIHKYPLITIPQGQIAYVFARDGKPLTPEQTLGKVITEAMNFQDVRGFLQNGGQRGPQRGILREGTYAINLAQFIVITHDSIKSISGNREEMGIISGMQETLKSRDAFHPIIIMGNNAEQSDLMGIVTVHDAG